MPEKSPAIWKLGDYSFEAVRFALQDFPHRVSGEKPALTHSHIRQIAFEGAGSLGGTVVKLSPELNTLIGSAAAANPPSLKGSDMPWTFRLARRPLTATTKKIWSVIY